MDGLLRDKTRPSRIPKLADEKVALVVRLTLEEDPPADGGEERRRLSVLTEFVPFVPNENVSA